MAFGQTTGRFQAVSVDATALFSGVVFQAQIELAKASREVLRELYEIARSQAGSSRKFLDANERPTAQLKHGSTVYDDSVSIEQQGVVTGDGVLPTILLVARTSWS